ncbi:MAG: TonB-dependent receptor [Ignavibacteria bacterium]|jgi:iron complex outermembrane receptor protein
MKNFLLINIVLFIYLISAFGSQLCSQTIEHRTEDVVVTAGRTPVSISNLSRNVLLIDKNEIALTPVSSIQDLLQFAGSVDLKQRGTIGIQADAGIRGGTFEQTLILIDGVKIIDPQTSHHNLNLPLSLDNLERVEILKGQGSRIFGPNAFSGAINFITKKESKPNLNLLIEGGQNGYYNTELNSSFSAGVLKNNVSIARQKSDGYRYNTDFEIINLSFNSLFPSKIGATKLFFGYSDKDYGANSFYSTSYPNQGEKTQTYFLNLSGDYGTENIIISPKVFWRKNNDDFVLDRSNISFYHNEHETNVYGFELQSVINSTLGKSSLGIEFIKDEITSNNLGERNRDKKGIFAEHLFAIAKKVDISLGGSFYNFSSIGWKVWPGIDAGINLSDNTRLFASIGKAFRVPSFTELFYNDPVTIGNPDLKHEETTNYELGFRINNLSVSSTISLFRKEGKNIIDWVRLEGSKPWSARNIAEVNTNGFEIDLSFSPISLIKKSPVKRINISYTYLDSDKKTDIFESRYVLDHLRHQFIVGIQNKFIFDIDQTWNFRYEDRSNFTDSFISDFQMSKQVNKFLIFVKASNLFNSYYEDIAGIPLPGRWITGGVKFTIN